MKIIIPMPPLSKAEISSFLSKADKKKNGGCWIWTRYLSSAGYGQVGFNYKLYLAHRISYYIHFKVDPGPKQVCHKCDNPACINPKHLFLGSQKDNMADMTKKGRADHTKNNRGEKVGTSKLTESQVKEIWDKHLHSGLGERKLGLMFNVTPANIHCILSGQSWKHLIPKVIAPSKKPKQGFRRTYPCTSS